MVDNTKLFSHKSEDYSQFRSSYPPAAVDWIRSRAAGDCAVDIGAGTGIFTRLLHQRFKNVSAVEPNEDMRSVLLKNLPDISCFDTVGEATGLPECSMDLITIAQAFHWLDEDKFKKEALRILRPSGKVAIIWNNSLKSTFTEERNRICQKYCPRFRSGYAGKRSVAEGDEFLRTRYFRNIEVAVFSNPFVMDWRIFEGNMRSRSYALMPRDPDYEAFMSELRSLFAAYAQDGTVTELQETKIYLGCF